MVHTSQTTGRTHQRDGSDVVVIYDDPDIGFILARTLEKMGYQVESVSYRESLLSRLRGRGFGLAVLEVKMGDASALGKLDAIREADPGLPLILVSGLGDSIGRILQLGIEGWIEKPFQLEEVRAAVKEVLDWKDNGGREYRGTSGRDSPAGERANSPMKAWSSLDGEKTLDE